MAKTSKKVEMTREKDCNRSVKYRSSDPVAVINNVYLSRLYAPEAMPDKITITVESA